MTCYVCILLLLLLCSSSLKSTDGWRDSGEKLTRGLAAALATSTVVDAPTVDTTGGTEESVQGGAEG